MERLTTDKPCSNFQNLMNYAYAKEGRVIMRYADGNDDADLCEYIAEEASGKSCAPSADEVMEGACMECDCPLAILQAVATQAAELRGRLKMIEDILGDDYDLEDLRKILKPDGKFSPGNTVYIVERDIAGNPDDASGFMLLAVTGEAVIVTSFINDMETLKEHIDYHIEETADNYDTHLSVFPLCDCYQTIEDAKAALKGEQEDATV